MYSPEELRTLMILLGAAVLGRLLFYRSLLARGSFKQKLKIRCLQWLWELPVVMVVALLAFEVVTHFKLREHSGIMVSVAFGFIGVNTLKVWVEDWLESKLPRKNLGRREEDRDGD